MDLRAGRESTSDVPRRGSEGESGRRKTDQGGVALRSAPTITPEQDAAYMNAVESGDMEMAQQMVNEAARKAGKHCGKWFHGSPQSERFEIFTPKPERSFGVPSNAIGSWFTPDEEQARAFAEEMDGVGHESCPGKNGRGSSDLVREVGL